MFLRVLGVCKAKLAAGIYRIFMYSDKHYISHKRSKSESLDVSPNIYDINNVVVMSQDDYTLTEYSAVHQVYLYFAECCS